MDFGLKRSFTRREWLAQTAFMAGALSALSPLRVLAGAITAPPKPLAPRDLYLFSFEKRPAGDTYDSGLSVLWDRGKNTFTNIISEGYAHSFSPFPHDPSRFLGVGKRNGFIGILDTKLETCPTAFSPTNNHTPNGHAVFSPDGSEIFLSEIEKVSGVGKIVVRDSRTFNVRREFSSYGRRPHELKFHADGKTITVANFSGGVGLSGCNLVQIDAVSGKQLRRFDADRAFRGGHFHTTKDGYHLVGVVSFAEGAEEDSCAGAIWVIDPRGKYRWLEAPPEFKEYLKGDTAAISVNEATGVVYGIGHNGIGILGWNYRTGAFVGQWLTRGTAGFDPLPLDRNELITTQIIDAKTCSVLILDGNSLAVKTRIPFPLQDFIPNPHIAHVTA